MKFSQIPLLLVKKVPVAMVCAPLLGLAYFKCEEYVPKYNLNAIAFASSLQLIAVWGISAFVPFLVVPGLIVPMLDSRMEADKYRSTKQQ